MGQFNTSIPEELYKFLERLESSTDEVCMNAVKQAESVMVDALKEECEKHKTSGALTESIKATGPKKNQRGIYDYVRPTGRDEKGIRNMEKLAHLEYGTIKQAATPVCQKVVNRLEKQVPDIVQKEVEKGFFQ